MQAELEASAISFNTVMDSCGKAEAPASDGKLTDAGVKARSARMNVIDLGIPCFQFVNFSVLCLSCFIEASKMPGLEGTGKAAGEQAGRLEDDSPSNNRNLLPTPHTRFLLGFRLKLP